MKYISVAEYAALHGVSERTVRNYCATGRINGAFLTGKTWNIPEEALLPVRKSRRRVMPLLKVLREQMEMRLQGGIYHKTQIDLTYNSNHIEGSRLSHDQTRYIFETNTIGMTDGTVNVDDVIETVNHFRCIDYIVEHAEDRLTEAFIKRLHMMLKQGSSDSVKSWFVTGGYKRLPNEVGGNSTCSPENVAAEMAVLTSRYNDVKTKTLENVIDFHVKFERIHPFQDGNGRVGRLIMFKECLANGIVPFIIADDIKMFYYRGLQEWGHINGYLMDTCLSAQDDYKAVMDYFAVPQK